MEPTGSRKISRTRTGCLTCRRRRKKCDEGVPCCRNCSRASRHCEYGKWIRFRNVSAGTGIEAPASGPTSDPPMRVSLNRGGLIRHMAAESSLQADSVALQNLESTKTEDCSDSSDHGDEAAQPSVISAPVESSPGTTNTPESINSSQFSKSGHELHIHDAMIQETNQDQPPSLPASCASVASDGALFSSNGFDDPFLIAGRPSDLSFLWDFPQEFLPAHHIDRSPSDNATQHAPGPAQEDASEVLCDPSGDKSAATELTLQEETTLIQAYLQHVGQWMENSDPDRHFTLKCVHQLLGDSTCRASILAISARFKYLTDSSYSSRSSLELYQKAVQKLINSSQARNDCGILASCVLLAVYEMMTSKYSDWLRHLQGCAALLKLNGWTASTGGLVTSCFWSFAKVGE